VKDRTIICVRMAESETIPAHHGLDPLPKTSGFLQLKRLVVTASMPRETRWEGKLTGADGSCRKFSCELDLILLFRGGVLAGQGVGLKFRDKSEDSSFEIFGSADDAEVAFNLQSNASFLLRTPFVCVGSLNGRRTKIAGRFRLQCFLPTTCGCGGVWATSTSGGSPTADRVTKLISRATISQIGGRRYDFNKECEMIDPSGGPNPIYRACGEGDLKSVLALAAGMIIANGLMVLLCLFLA
jgi:hypothetical protein